MEEYLKLIYTLGFLFIGYAFFMLNPYNILDYIYLPFVVFFTMIGIFIFFNIDNKDINVMTYLYKILYFVGIFLLCVIVYILLKLIVLYTINISFGAMFLLYLVTFALIHHLFIGDGNASYDNNKSEDLFQVIKYFIFYIPCLLILVINYFINDAKQTNKTTYILGLMLILLIVIYFVIPIVMNYIKNDLVLIEDKEYLNKSILTMTLKEIKEKIPKGLFYKEGFNSLSEVNIPNIETIEINTTDPMEDLIDKYKDNPELLRQYVKAEINKSFINKMYYYTKSIFSDEKDLITQYVTPIYHTYHYGITFDLFLNSNILAEKNRDKALILSLGSRPSLYYDYNTRELIIEITDKVNKKTFKQTRIYNSSKILFQKWNTIVMNYVNGQFDLFVNNEIVSTQSNVSPYINDSEVLQVGSVENSDIGAICKLIYHDQPLSLYQINKINN